MTELAQEKCIPFKTGTLPLTEEEATQLLAEIPEWQMVSVEGIPRLKREYQFDNFVKALAFTNAVGELAEEQGHHPLITLTWGKASVEWWSHEIKGLHRNDFIMASKTDVAYQ